MKKEHVIIGTLAIIGIMVLYNHIQKNRPKPKIFVRKKLAGNYNARTIPPFGIFIKESEKENKMLIDHELVHWQQYKKLGLVKYYAQYLKQMREVGYDNMPMEIEARVNETDFCKKNYTECVRIGEAKTIYNPDFRK